MKFVENFFFRGKKVLFFLQWKLQHIKGVSLIGLRKDCQKVDFVVWIAEKIYTYCWEHLYILLRKQTGVANMFGAYFYRSEVFSCLFAQVHGILNDWFNHENECWKDQRTHYVWGCLKGSVHTVKLTTLPHQQQNRWNYFCLYETFYTLHAALLHPETSWPTFCLIFLPFLWKWMVHFVSSISLR